MEMPFRNTSPSVGSSIVAMIRMVVVLPAPLGPTNPNTCPPSKANEMSSTATVLPNSLRRFWTCTFMSGGFEDAVNHAPRPGARRFRFRSEAIFQKGIRLELSDVSVRQQIIRGVVGDAVQRLGRGSVQKTAKAGVRVNLGTRDASRQ